MATPRRKPEFTFKPINANNNNVIPFPMYMAPQRDLAMVA
jgi:hypothetical protein